MEGIRHALTASRRATRAELPSAAIVYRPATVGAEGVQSLVTATLAALASLPGCEMAACLPCPWELPPVGRC